MWCQDQWYFQFPTNEPESQCTRFTLRIGSCTVTSVKNHDELKLWHWSCTRAKYREIPQVKYQTLCFSWLIRFLVICWTLWNEISSHFYNSTKQWWQRGWVTPRGLVPAEALCASHCTCVCWNCLFSLYYCISLSYAYSFIWDWQQWIPNWYSFFIKAYG